VQCVEMSSFAIRTAMPAEVADLGDVYRRASLSNEGDRANLLAHPDALQFDDRAVGEGRTRAAFDGDTLLGFATTRGVGELVELDDLFVDPDRMRQGAGRLLVLDAITRARASGARRMEVTANGHALAFYRAVGFVLDGRAETQFGTGFRMHLDIAT
jgi:GNAT superfamily N-acetyltransferase